MKLKQLLEAVGREVEGADLTVERSTLSLAFVARKDHSGEVECDFIDASEVSKPREGEIHRLELELGRPDDLGEPPVAKSTKKARKKTRLPLKMSSAKGLFSKGETSDVDAPAIYRARPATS